MQRQDVSSELTEWWGARRTQAPRRRRRATRVVKMIKVMKRCWSATFAWIQRETPSSVCVDISFGTLTLELKLSNNLLPDLFYTPSSYLNSWPPV